MLIIPFLLSFDMMSEGQGVPAIPTFIMTTNTQTTTRLSLSLDTALGVGDLDAESLGLGDDVDTLAGRDSGSDPKDVVVRLARR